MYVCIYIGFVPLFPASPLKAAADLTFFNLRKSLSHVYIYATIFFYYAFPWPTIHRYLYYTDLATMKIKTIIVFQYSTIIR